MAGSRLPLFQAEVGKIPAKQDRTDAESPPPSPADGDVGRFRQSKVVPIKSRHLLRRLPPSRKDSGRARSYRWLRLKPSDDQSGLVTLEWIILIAAVSGIVTLALLAGWNALWNRSDSLSDEGGSGHQLAANRAAAEASSGRACSLLNDLYSYDFKYVPVAGSTGCTCEIDSEATASQVCDVEKVENADLTIGLQKGGTPREFDVSQLFFSENSADLRYTLVAPLADTSLIATALSSPTLTLTPITGSGAREGTTAVVVQAEDTNTTSTATARISVEVESDCVLDRSRRQSFSHSRTVPTFSSDVGDRILILHLNPYFSVPATSITATSSNSDVLEVRPPSYLTGEITVVVVILKRTGVAKLTLEATYCDSNIETLEQSIAINTNSLVQAVIPDQAYSTSPQTINLADHFNEAAFQEPVSYVVNIVDDRIVSTSISGSILTINKVANGRGRIGVRAVSNEAYHGLDFYVTFS